MLAAEAPPPPSWMLRTISVSIGMFADYSVNGVWRFLQRYDLELRSANVQQHSGLITTVIIPKCGPPDYGISKVCVIELHTVKTYIARVSTSY